MLVMLCGFVMVQMFITTLNLHEMQTDKTLEISKHTNINTNVTCFQHTVILVHIEMFSVKHVMHVNVCLSVIQCECMRVPISEHVYMYVYTSVSVIFYFHSLVLKITKIC